MGKTVLHKITMAGSISAAYLAIQCPCARSLSCHKEAYLLSVGIATVAMLADNGMLPFLTGA